MSKVAPLPLEYPHTARTSLDIDPSLVTVGLYGYHRSAVVRGERVWWFESATALNLFLHDARIGELDREVTSATR